MGKKAGLLLDVSGIQNYIFGTNMLRQNIGASWIVSHVLSEEYLLSCATTITASQIVYQGGGNALLLFEAEDQAGEFSKLWSLKILRDYPGLQAVAGIYLGEYPEDETSDGFQSFLANCREALFQSRSRYSASNKIPRFGLTRECVFTGESAQYYDTGLASKASKGLPISYSQEAKLKFENYINAEKALSKEYTGQLEGYTFTDNFEELAGVTGEDHKASMAVIHIDGNDMGKRFSALQSLKQFKQMSTAVSTLFEEALGQIIAKTVELLHRDTELLEKMGLPVGMLPIRPIILGGDDVTYVCHASLGLWSAQLFLAVLEQLQDDSDSRITACAGIAYTKPSYPFNQGYDIAEALCSSAKGKRRRYLDQLADQSELSRAKYDLSLLDFHIIQGGVFGDLDQARETGYSDEHGLLIGRPFAIGKGQEGYAALEKMAVDVARWPSGKIKELREVAYKGRTEIEKFFVHCESQDLVVPDILKTRGRTVLGNPTELDICEYLDQVPQWIRQQKMETGNGA